ncbi:hypothetical protein MPDQ_006217 [Monascus purpureus]|uniref:Aspergillopepsin-2 n=1 Tax=Monascus purpureus TaxID=5098 RepID=A0A507QZ55_MONPU|nr:hypothetical protein MPDQ_006217 [Monascus purpureus]BDD60302.1 hypothetical protein MAP00_005441 [Monascus purpureus]
MKFITGIFAASLLAGSALAAPRGSQAQRIKTRMPSFSHLTHGIEKTGVNEFKNLTHINSSQAEYSNNWSGAVLEEPPSSQATFTAVSATFTVPKPTAGVALGGSEGYQAASAWIGIDGDTSSNAILQTGVDFILQNGQASYQAWYEWLPNTAVNFDLDINAGDVIVAYVRTSDNSHGIAVIENHTSGKNASKTLSAPSASATLQGVNAEWIVEDFEMSGGLVPMVDFGKVTFTGAVAETSQGAVGLDGAHILDIRQDGLVLTDADILSSSEVVVTYTGGSGTGGFPPSRGSGSGDNGSGEGLSGPLDPFGFGDIPVVVTIADGTGDVSIDESFV